MTRKPARPSALANVLVGTPAYGGMVHITYVRSLFSFQGAGIRFQLGSIGNESLITRARNSILSVFHARPEFTHLLFLDADVYLSGPDLARMLDADVPVLGAAVALKALNASGERIWNIGACKGSHGALLKVENVGTAALLLSRAAVAALVDDAVAAGRVYGRSNTTQGDFDTDVHYDVFRTGVHQGVYLSEDYWACRILHALGFDILIDPGVVTTHHGVMAV